jgi:hypothetical protein
LIELGAIVPHAPLLIEDAAGPLVTSAAQATVDAMASLNVRGVDLVVVVSPHGGRTGVYGATRGSLAAFDVRGVSLDHLSDDEAAKEIAETWGQPLLEDRVDHGVLVPLLLLDLGDVPAVGCSFAESAPPEEIRAEARQLAAALSRLAEKRTLAVLVSMNTSAALSPRAPLTELPAGKALDEALLDRLSGGTDKDIAVEMWAAAGSCGLGPFTVWTELFAQQPIRRVSYEAPYGVGYLVATSP